MVTVFRPVFACAISAQPFRSKSAVVMPRAPACEAIACVLKETFCAPAFAAEQSSVTEAMPMEIAARMERPRGGRWPRPTRPPRRVAKAQPDQPVLEVHDIAFQLHATS